MDHHLEPLSCTLEWLHLVKEALPRPSHEEFRLWNVTKKDCRKYLVNISKHTETADKTT